MDTIDLQIIASLLQDGRITMKELGHRVGLTSPATIERVKKLEETDVISGYTAVVNINKVGLPVRAFVLVKVAGNDASKSLVAFCSTHRRVISCHRITGDADYIVEVATPAMDVLETVIDEFRQYGVTTTQVILSSPMEHNVVSVVK